MTGVMVNMLVVILVVSVLSCVRSEEYSATGTSIDVQENIYFFPSTFWLYRSVSSTTFTYDLTFPKSHGGFTLLLFQNFKGEDSLNKTCNEYKSKASWSMMMNTDGPHCQYDHFDGYYKEEMFRCSGSFTVYNLQVGQVNQFAFLANCEKKRIVLTGYSLRIDGAELVSSGVKTAIKVAPLLVVMASVVLQIFM